MEGWALVGLEGASPSPAPGVCWLDHRSVAQASPADAREDAPAHRPEQRPPGRRGHAPRPLGRQPQRMLRATGAPSLLDGGGALYRAPPQSALPVPLVDRRSSILGDPTTRRFPENRSGAPIGAPRAVPPPVPESSPASVLPSVHALTKECRGLEDRYIAGWNLDGFTGPGVAGIAVAHLEDAESTEFDAVASR